MIQLQNCTLNSCMEGLKIFYILNTLDKWQTVIPMLYSPNNLVRSVVGTMREETVQYSQRTMKNIAFCYFTYVSKQKQTRPLVKRAILQNWQMLSLLLCDVIIFYRVWRESLL